VPKNGSKAKDQQKSSVTVFRQDGMYDLPDLRTYGKLMVLDYTIDKFIMAEFISLIIAV